MGSCDFLRFYFIRHGETIYSKKSSFCGWLDAKLSPAGEEQLKTAAQALKDIKFDAIYSSDLSRAVFGAGELARLSGSPAFIEPKWREISFGDWEGLTYDEICQRDEHKLVERVFDLHGDSSLKFPGGESSAEFFARIGQALKDLVARHPSGKVALFAHSGVGRAIWGNLFALASPSAIWSIHQDFACLNVVDIYPGGFFSARLMNGYLGPEGYYQKGPGYERLL